MTGAAPDPRVDLPLRTSRDTEGEVRRVLEKLEAAGRDFKIVRLLANSPAGFRPYVLMSAGLMNRTTIPDHVREAVILRLAAQRPTPYEWEEHIGLSEAAGVTPTQRSAIAEGDYAALDDAQRLALAVVDEFAAERGVSPARWQAMTDLWGPAGALDLVLVIAWWGGFVPTVIEALGLRSPVIEV